MNKSLPKVITAKPENYTKTWTFHQPEIRNAKPLNLNYIRTHSALKL